jgi:hypothetical protein
MRETVILHEAIESTQLREALRALLLGKRGRRTVRINGADVPIPVYLRTIARLCNEAAERAGAAEPELEEAPLAPAEMEGFAPVEEQLIMGGGVHVLKKPVGAGKAANDTDDVKLVQHLLNFNLPVPASPLLENGTIDAATIDAIKNYQSFILGVKTPDGVVDPKGQTFQSLMANKLSFYPHVCQAPAAGSPVPVDATSMNPGFLTPAGVTRDAGLQAIVNRRITAFQDLRFALVDLTGAGKLATPLYAGQRDLVQGGLGSMAKLACMYAAWQLKFDLEDLSKQKSITDIALLFAAARDVWDGTQKPDPANTTTLFAADPKLELLGKLVVIDGKPVAALKAFSAPNLERIFSAVPSGSGGLTLRFLGSDSILVDPSVPGSPPLTTLKVRNYVSGGGGDLRAVRKLSFAERLFLMIDDSDNAAAHSCIEDIGFLYITSALWQADFYRPQRGGGLWESSTHDGGGRWLMPPVPRKKDNPAADFVSATAASIAAVLTLLEQSRLVNSNSSAGMKHLMDKQKPGFGSFSRSPFLDGLRTILSPDSLLVRIDSKLGIGSHRSDCAIIVRSVPDPVDPTKQKEFRYVAAGFDDPKKFGPALQKLIVELDKCIRENNGLPA